MYIIKIILKNTSVLTLKVQCTTWNFSKRNLLIMNVLRKPFNKFTIEKIQVHQLLWFYK